LHFNFLNVYVLVVSVVHTSNKNAIIFARYLMEYSNSGRFRNLDLIDNLGSTMLLTPQLTFLGLIFFHYCKCFINSFVLQYEIPYI